ncbi:hypothetical protein ABPG72_005894 [Tetrahymena utriculariae]
MLPFSQERLQIDGNDIFYYNRYCLIPEIYLYSRQLHEDLSNYLGIEFELNQRLKFSQAVDDQGKPGEYSTYKIQRITTLYDFYVDTVLNTTQLLYYEVFNNTNLYTFCSSISTALQKLFVPNDQANNPKFNVIEIEKINDLIKSTDQTKKDTRMLNKIQQILEQKQKQQQQNSRPIQLNIAEDKEQKKVIKEQQEEIQELKKNIKLSKQELREKVSKLEEDLSLKEAERNKQNEKKKKYKQELQRTKNNQKNDQSNIEQSQSELEEIKQKLRDQQNRNELVSAQFMKQRDKKKKYKNQVKENEEKILKSEDLQRQYELKNQELQRLNNELQNLQSLYDSHYQFSQQKEEENKGIISRMKDQEKEYLNGVQQLKRDVHNKDLELGKLAEQLSQLNINVNVSRIQAEEEMNRSKLQMEEQMKSNIKQISDQAQQQINIQQQQIDNSNQLISQYQSQIQQYENSVVEKEQIVQQQSNRIAQLENLISQYEIEANNYANEQNEKWVNYNLDVDQRIKKLESELEQSKQQNLYDNQQIAVLQNNLNEQIQKENNLNSIIQDTQSKWSNNLDKIDLVRLGLKRENEQLKEIIGDNIQDFINEVENHTKQDILLMKWNDIVNYAQNYIEFHQLKQQYYEMQKTKLDRELMKYQSNLIPIEMRQTILDRNIQQQQQPQLYQQLNQQQQNLPQNYNWPVDNINLQDTILDQNLQLLRQSQQIQQNLLQSQIQSQHQLPEQVIPQNLAQSIQIDQQQQPQFNQQVNEVFTVISSHAHNNKAVINPQQLIERLQTLLQHLPNHQQQIQQFIDQLQIAFHAQIKPSYKQIRKNYREYNKEIVRFLNGLGFQYQKPN